MSQTKKMLLPLTSLRFFAAAMIVVLHSQGYSYGVPAVFAKFQLDGAVSFFFILSGFILSYVYPKLEKEKAPKFFLARFARLWPAHVATAVLVMIVAPQRLTAATHDAPALLIPLAQLLMVHAWIPLGAFYASLNSVSWSISTEFFFYILFPFLQRLSRRGLLAAFAGIAMVTATIIAGCAWYEIPFYEGYKNNLTLYGLTYVAPFCRVLEFATGILLYRLYKHFQWGQPQPSSLLKDTLLELGTLLLVLGGLALGASSWVHSVFEQVPAVGLYLKKQGATLVPFALFIYVMARGGGLLSRVLSWQPLVFLGEISYAMYMVHMALLWYFQGREPAWWVYWAVVLAASWLIYQLVEKPMRFGIIQAGSRWLEKKAPAQQPASLSAPADQQVAG